MNRQILIAACLIASAPTLYSQSTVESQKAWKLDWQIAAQVQKVINDEPAFAGTSIQSNVKNRVVTLFGNVNNETAKILASTEVGNLADVKTVLNNLVVVTRNVPKQPAAPAATIVPKTITLPVGTVISVRTIDGLTTKTAKMNDTFRGTTTTAIVRDGFTLIPAGTSVTGHVVAAQPATHFTGAALLSIELVSLQLTGTTGPQDVTVVTKPLTNKAAARGANTAEKTGGGAAAGAIIGALAGGGKGAGIGAASGGALGAGVNAITTGKEVELKPEQLLSFHTDAPLDIAVQTQGGQQIAAQSATGATLLPRANAAPASAGLIDLPNQADPATFDILTLKLGMTVKEAATAITARIPGIQQAYPSPADAQFTSGRKYTSAALYSTERFKALLTFTESYPFDPARPEQLTSINYEAFTATEADRQQFRESIIKKYGQPYREVKGLSALWCSKGTSLGSGPLACAPDLPTLQLKGNELTLRDSGPYHREQAAWNTKTTSTPPI